jgi:deoxyribodipyrimidine photolyase-like uncharacterized protein
MILSNLALIRATDPKAWLDWMRENFVDAIQFSMVPNVSGMPVHSVGRRMVAKPFAADLGGFEQGQNRGMGRFAQLKPAKTCFC